MMKKRRIFLFLVLFALAAGFASFFRESEEEQFVRKLGAGWNLGNTLDAHTEYRKQGSRNPQVFETYWHNPVTKKETFEAVQKAGFKTVRIPVTWYEHMDAAGVIQKEWMDRVEQVVREALDSGLYVILDIHHEDWLKTAGNNYKESSQRLKVVWRQIAQRFADYDERLLFEGINEPRLNGEEEEWGVGTKEAREIVNQYNRIFVETVRSCGGENDSRYLLVAPYCNSWEEEALKDFELPEGKRLLVSIHAYIPYGFAMKEDGTAQWSAKNPEDTEEIDRMFHDLEYFFTSKGIPVVITEFGTANKDNLPDRLEWTEYFTKKARKNHISYLWWDEGGKNGKYQIFDRKSQTWVFPEIMEKLLAKTEF